MSFKYQLYISCLPTYSRFYFTPNQDILYLCIKGFCNGFISSVLFHISHIKQIHIGHKAVRT